MGCFGDGGMDSVGPEVVRKLESEARTNSGFRSRTRPSHLFTGNLVPVLSTCNSRASFGVLWLLKRF